MSGTAAMAPGGKPRRIIVLRHGQTDHNAKGIWQGQLDAALSPKGHAQALAAAAALVRYSPVRVVASDLQRAADTGADVARACGIPIAVDPRWREIHAGHWQGLTNDEVRSRFPEDRARHDRGEDFKRGGDGESISDVAGRVREALHELVRSMGSGETVVIATHGVSGRATVAELVDIPQDLAWQRLVGLSNCHWAEVVEGGNGWRLAAWNAAP
ncbi:MAG: histidine phosphatase family protein [Nostocoides sp.]